MSKIIDYPTMATVFRTVSPAGGVTVLHFVMTFPACVRPLYARIR